MQYCTVLCVALYVVVVYTTVVVVLVLVLALASASFMRTRAYDRRVVGGTGVLLVRASTSSTLVKCSTDLWDIPYSTVLVLVSSRLSSGRAQ